MRLRPSWLAAVRICPLDLREGPGGWSLADEERGQQRPSLLHGEPDAPSAPQVCCGSWSMGRSTCSPCPAPMPGPSSPSHGWSSEAKSASPAPRLATRPPSPSTRSLSTGARSTGRWRPGPALSPSDHKAPGPFSPSEAWVPAGRCVDDQTPVNGSFSGDRSLGQSSDPFPVRRGAEIRASGVIVTSHSPCLRLICSDTVGP